MTKVSVLVPIHNVEQYLPECLDSLCAQTLKSIEIICINDGSTDASGAILDEYAKNNSNIVVINKKNSGYGDSMNRGLEAATGEYIGIVESDDFIDQNGFEKLYELAKKTDADIVKANYYYHSEDKDEIHEVVKNQKTNKATTISDDYNILIEEPGIWSAIYRRDFLNENKIRFRTTPGASYQDTGFFFKTACTAKKIVYTKNAFLHYRTDNANSSVKSLEKVNYVVEEYADIEKFLEKCEVSDEVKYTIQAAKFGAFHWNLQRLPKDLAKEFIVTIKQEFSKADKAGLLQKKYFPTKYWLALQLILKSSTKTSASVLQFRKKLHRR
ncbi:glycosyltransferase [Candidatus Saccharibacteria bacterium]|nr:glycosyltransferase [Candidatus Saccharibacteria bacterium]